MDGFGFNSNSGSSSNNIIIIKKKTKSIDFETIIPADSKLLFIDIKPVSGNPTVSVYYTVGVIEILPSTLITETISIDMNIYLETATGITVTISGGGIDVFFTYLSNFDL
jgi:hypothetical protein